MVPTPSSTSSRTNSAMSFLPSGGRDELDRRTVGFHRHSAERREQCRR
jgi:hypothetical protein